MADRASAYDVLQAQVRAIEEDHRDLKEVVIGTDRKIDRVAADLSKAISDGLGKLYDQLNARNKTPWGVIFSGIGVGVGVIVAIGTLAYTPVWTSIADLKSEAHDVRLNIVPRVEHEQRWRLQDRDQERAREEARLLRAEGQKTRSDLDFLRGQLSIVLKTPQQ